MAKRRLSPAVTLENAFILDVSGEDAYRRSILGNGDRRRLPQAHKVLSFNLPFMHDHFSSSNPAFFCQLRGTAKRIVQLFARAIGAEIRTLGTGEPVAAAAAVVVSGRKRGRPKKSTVDTTAKTKKKKKRSLTFDLFADEGSELPSVSDPEDDEEEEEGEVDESSDVPPAALAGDKKESFYFSADNVPKVSVLVEELENYLSQVIGVRVWVVQYDPALNVGVAFQRALRQGLAAEETPAVSKRSAAEKKRESQRLENIVESWWEPKANDDALLFDQTIGAYARLAGVSLDGDRQRAAAITDTSSEMSPYAIFSPQNAMRAMLPSGLRAEQRTLDTYLDAEQRLRIGSFRASVIRPEYFTPYQLPRVPLPAFVRSQIALRRRVHSHFSRVARIAAAREALAFAIDFGKLDQPEKKKKKKKGRKKKNDDDDGGGEESAEEEEGDAEEPSHAQLLDALVPVELSRRLCEQRQKIAAMTGHSDSDGAGVVAALLNDDDDELKAERDELERLELLREAHVLRDLLPLLSLRNDSATESSSSSSYKDGVVSLLARLLETAMRRQLTREAEILRLARRVDDDDDDDDDLIDRAMGLKMTSMADVASVRLLRRSLPQFMAEVRSGVHGEHLRQLSCADRSPLPAPGVQQTRDAVRTLAFLVALKTRLLQEGVHFFSDTRRNVKSRSHLEGVLRVREEIEIALNEERVRHDATVRFLEEEVFSPVISVREAMAVVDHHTRNTYTPAKLYDARRKIPDIDLVGIATDMRQPEPLTVDPDELLLAPYPEEATLHGRVQSMRRAMRAMQRWTDVGGTPALDEESPLELSKSLRKIGEEVLAACYDDAQSRMRKEMMFGGGGGDDDDDDDSDIDDELDLMALERRQQQAAADGAVVGEEENLLDETGFEKLLAKHNVSLLYRMRNRFEKKQLLETLTGGGLAERPEQQRAEMRKFRERKALAAWELLIENRDETRLSHPTLAMRAYWHDVLAPLGDDMFRGMSVGTATTNLSTFGNMIAALTNDLDMAFRVNVSFVLTILLYVGGVLNSAQHNLTKANLVFVLASTTMMGKSFLMNLLAMVLSFPGQCRQTTYSSNKADTTSGDYGDGPELQDEANLDELGMGVNGSESERHQRWKMTVTNPVRVTDVFSMREADKGERRREIDVNRANINKILGLNATRKLGTEEGGATLSRCIVLPLVNGERVEHSKNETVYQSEANERSRLYDRVRSIWRLRSWLVFLCERLIEQGVLDDVDTDSVPLIAQPIFDQFELHEHAKHPSARHMQSIRSICRSMAVLHAVHVVFFSELAVQRGVNRCAFSVLDMLLLQPYLYVTDEMVVWVVTALNSFSDVQERSNILQGFRVCTHPEPVPDTYARFSLARHRDLFEESASGRGGERDWNYITIRGPTRRFLINQVARMSPKMPSSENTYRVLQRMTLQMVTAHPMHWVKPVPPVEEEQGIDVVFDLHRWEEEHAILQEDTTQRKCTLPALKILPEVAPNRPGSRPASICIHISLLMQSAVDGMHEIIRKALAHRFQTTTRPFILGTNFYFANHPQHYDRMRVRNVDAAVPGERVLNEDAGQQETLLDPERVFEGFTPEMQALVDRLREKPLYNVCDVVTVAPDPARLMVFSNTTAPTVAQIAMAYSGAMDADDMALEEDMCVVGDTRLKYLDAEDVNVYAVSRVQRNSFLEQSDAELAYPPVLFRAVIAARKACEQMFISLKPFYSAYPHDFVKYILKCMISERRQRQLVEKLEKNNNNLDSLTPDERVLFERGRYSRVAGTETVLAAAIPAPPRHSSVNEFSRITQMLIGHDSVVEQLRRQRQGLNHPNLGTYAPLAPREQALIPVEPPPRVIEDMQMDGFSNFIRTALQKNGRRRKK